MRVTTLMRLCALSCGVAWGTPALAGGGPENVFLIVNDRGAKSKEVANHYIALRHIPPNNVFYALAPPAANVISGADFRQKVLMPVLAAIERRGLADQIDHIVYSCEFPWRVDFTPMFAAANLPPTNRPIASLTGATYLSSFVLESDASLVELTTNFYFAPTELGPTVTRAFRHKYRWAPGGARVENGGLQFYLATQLGSTSPTGNTTEEIIAYLERAAGADGTRPAGTFYFMQNNDVRSRARLAGFPAAVKELAALGLKAVVMNGVVPSGRPDVLGLTTGSANVPLRGSGAALVPGALVDNLTSQGAVLTRPAAPNPQTRVSEYLRLGAAGASGTVVEPFAIAQKFPAPALHVHYARGASMAEAFYQAVQGPYQLLIVGDPLCQPWARIPQVAVSGVADGAMVSGTLEIAPQASVAAGQSVSRWELYVDGKRSEVGGAGKAFALDTTKLADGYHELRVVATDASPLETQGRWIAGVIVKNGVDALSLTTTAGPRTSAAQIELSVASTTGAETAVYHNGRELGRVKSPGGKLTVATEQLGKGPVALEARTVGKPSLSSRPLRLEIE